MDYFPEIGEVLNIPLDKCITFSVDDCGYNFSAHDIMVNWFHPFFLKSKSDASKTDNPDLWQVMNGPFSGEYWKSSCKEIQTLGGMEAWEVVDRTE